MRLRLFERVRQLAHPRRGRFRPRRDRAGEAARHDRPGEARPAARLGPPRGQAPPAGPEVAGRHRRGALDGYAPPRPPWEEPPAPPWGEPSAAWGGDGPLTPPGHGRIPPPAGPPPAHLPPAGPAFRPPPGSSAGPRTGPQARPPAGPRTGPQARPPGGAGQGDPSAVPVGGARARVRPSPKPYGTAPVVPVEAPRAAAREAERAQARPATDRRWLEADRGYLPAQRPASAAQPRLPFAHAHEPSQANLRDGRRNCGTLETVLWRQWESATYVPDEAVLAIDRLAELPQQIKDKLVAGLDGIFVGPGGVPQLDDMTALSGVPLPSGRATWDACAGA